MSCVLRAVGNSFDVDAFLRGSAFTTTAVFRRGEPRLAESPDGPKRGASGFNLPVSEAGLDDLFAQVEDAERFLRENEDELRRLSRFPGVEEVCLDYGIRRQDVPTQSDLFPADLLWQAGALDIDLVVTHYATAEGRPS